MVPRLANTSSWNEFGGAQGKKSFPRGKVSQSNVTPKPDKYKATWIQTVRATNWNGVSPETYGKNKTNMVNQTPWIIGGIFFFIFRRLIYVSPICFVAVFDLWSAAVLNYHLCDFVLQTTINHTIPEIKYHCESIWKVTSCCLSHNTTILKRF